MITRTNCCILCWFASFLLTARIAQPVSLSDDYRNRFAEIYSMCRDEVDSGPEEDLVALAKAQGLSNEEMAGLLLQIIDEGLAENADSNQRYMADCALWGLVPFAGEKELAFIRELMRTTKDVKGIRRTAIMVGPRIAPEKWEELLREVVADKRSDDFDRFLVCREAFQVARAGDKKTQRRVVEVFGEMKARGVSESNQKHLEKWIGELEKMP